MAQTCIKRNCKITLAILRFISATCGIVFLYKSSFSAKQFEDASEEEVVLTFFALFLVFVFAFVITPWICVGSFKCVCRSHFLTKAAVNIFALTLASLEIFLSKYPRFKTQSEVRKFSTEGGETRQKQIFSMCSFGMFAFLALLLSGRDAVEFGVLNLLLELTIEASMEIPGENNGPNLWYLLGASMYCAVLVVIRSYLGPPSRARAREEDVEKGGAITRSTADESRRTCKITLSILRFISVTCGIVFLSQSSFSSEQFEDASKEEVVLLFFALFLVFVFAFVITPWICVGYCECVCRPHFLINAAVNIFALTLASLEIFLSKYPRFKTQSEVRKFSTEGGETRQRQIFSMCSFGMFAFLALLLSRKDALEFGVLNLLLGLTIDASMEIPGENHGPNLWYLLCASVYCAVLVLIRSYLGSPSRARAREEDVEEDGTATRAAV